MKNTLKKIAMVSLLSLSTLICTTQAKADERDGTVERFTCFKDDGASGRLKSTFVKVNANDTGKKFGFGGGDWAIKLSNDGFTASSPYESFAGGSATFVNQKKETQFKVYVKPVSAKLADCRLFICMRNPDGTPNYLFGSADSFITTNVGNGWYTISEDLDTYNGAFRNVTITRISLVLNALGDDGHLLMGNTQVYSHKDLLDPSTLVMDPVPCSDGLVCGAYNSR